MMEKIVQCQESWTSRDLVEILQLFECDKNMPLSRFINFDSKEVIAQEIDGLAIKEILSLFQLYKNDKGF